MQKAVFIRDSYSEGNATINRLWGFIHGFAAQGIAVEVAFVRPDALHSVCNLQTENVTFRYLWQERRLYANPKVDFAAQILSLNRYVRSLPKDVPIVLFGSDDVMWAASMLGQRRKIYYEVTEYPELHSENWSIIGRILHKLYKLSLSRLSGIFAISAALKKYFADGGFDADKIVITNMTVDTARFDNITKTAHAIRRVAYCGTVTNYKDGVDMLIRAFAKVAEKLPDVKLQIIGEYLYDTDRKTNAQIISESGIADRVEFTGKISSTEMPQLLTDADALVLARPDNIQARYGFPTKVGEYLLTGNPVVVTAVGDIPLFLHDGENAYVAEPNDTEGTANRIIAALTSPEAPQIGARGRQTAVEYFNSRTETQKMINYIYGTK